MAPMLCKSDRLIHSDCGQGTFSQAGGTCYGERWFTCSCCLQEVEVQRDIIPFLDEGERLVIIEGELYVRERAMSS